MKIKLLQVGKTNEKYLLEGIEKYYKRINRYISFEIQTIPELKNTKKLSQEQQKQQEGILIAKKIAPTDFLILLDEKGKSYSSINFARFIEEKAIQSTKQITFVIGGPYGFSKEIYQRANNKISLSTMTFSHQLIRLLFLEQVYRAYTIINKEPYHHE